MLPAHLWIEVKFPCQGSSSATKQRVDECNTLNHDSKINSKILAKTLNIDPLFLPKVVVQSCVA